MVVVAVVEVKSEPLYLLWAGLLGVREGLNPPP